MAYTQDQQAIVESHGNEDISAEGLMNALQKFKNDHVDTKVSGISFDSQTGKIRKTVNGQTSDVVQVYTKPQIDAMRSPTYDPTNKRITFPATAAFSYDSANKRITISQ